MLAFFVAGWALAIPLSVVNGHFQQDSVSLLVAFGAFMVVGAVIVAHRPDNAIGWIFSAIGLLSALGVIAVEYAAYAYLTGPGSPLPGAAWAVWYQEQWLLPMLVLIFVFTPLLFPTGRLLSARWRPVAVVATIAIVAITVLTALQPTLRLQDEDYTIPNPIGIAWAGEVEQSPVGGALFWLVTLCGIAAVASLVLRFRRSRGVERQQLKWFTYAGALVFVWTVLEPLPAGALREVLFGLVIALIPISAGIAILRYRLYEIDRLINRTLVYGLLTALLGGVYAATVLVLGQVFGGVGRGTPSWAVASATLTVAALFQPARRSIQAVVDRRFNRRKYNAANTVEAFSARLRDEVDLDMLSAELLAVVDQTVQPTQASLWLRPPAQPSRDTSGRPTPKADWEY